MRFILLRLLILIQATLMIHAPRFSFAASVSYPAKPGELVVKLKTDPSSKAGLVFSSIAQDLSKHLSLKNGVTYRVLKTSQQFAVLKLQNQKLKEARTILEKDSRVQYAEPNYLYHSFGTPASVVPSDADFAQLWGMKNSGQADSGGQVGKAGSDIHATEVWAAGVTGSKSIKVAVIDTGVDYNHPDLKDNVDATLGWNYVNNTADPRDDQNHGSHCAGTIGGVGNNGVGVVGVNWSVTIIPIKFLDASGSGTLDAAVQSIQHATQANVNIMSNSWGGGPYSQALYDVINEAKNKGILFVAAAGNNGSNNDGTPSYPASYAIDNVLSVAASDNQDKLASFSNYGIRSVHVAAPGVKIYSTEKDGAYGVMSGTSMATPHVAGIAALLLSANPSLTYADLRDRIIRSSDPVRALSRKVASGGRVNVYNALNEIYPVASGPDESAWTDVPMSIESAHPYENAKSTTYPISVPNAKYIRVIYDQVDTEAGYDKIEVSQASGEIIDAVSGQLSNYVGDYLEGDHATLVFKTDSSVNKWGFKISKVQAIF